MTSSVTANLRTHRLSQKMTLAAKVMALKKVSV